MLPVTVQQQPVFRYIPTPIVNGRFVVDRRKNYALIAVIAALLAAVIFIEIRIVFRMSSEQTMETGKYQLESISGELEGTISDAKDFTMQLAVAVQPYLGDINALTDLVYDRIDKLSDENNGAYNIYMAGTDWNILPGLADPEHFKPLERSWYTGAAKTPGSAYVSPPYVDVITGDLCYTVSVMLPDNDTVLSVDYTMERIQSHVVKMNETGLHNAVIVTDDGIIAGCSDESLLGESLTDSLPEYSAIFYLAKNSDEFVTHRIRKGLFNENLFATGSGSGSGWYLIVSESDWELYRNSYINLIVSLILVLVLIGVIIFLYSMNSKNRIKAENALKSKDEFLATITGELETPLKKILNNSDTRSNSDYESTQERFAGIHDAGEQLSYKIHQIISYTNIVKDEKKKKAHERRSGNGKVLHVNNRFRNIILVLLILVLLVTVSASLFLSKGLADSEMSNAVNRYEYRLSDWINKQKSILDMFTSIISTNPDMVTDYEGTVGYLDRLAQQYPEISALYLANPKLEPTVFMNTGWLPEPGWKVEERQWYIDTIAAKDQWSVSAPYYDKQTGLYCVTISEQVHDSKTGEFLGIFGIDFYMDKLIEILSGSYTDTGYAFLADAHGDIINHPYGKYQMSLEKTTNVSELEYGEISADGGSTMVVVDYDGVVRIITAKRSAISNFVVYKASNIWSIYGHGFVICLICTVTVAACIIMVYISLSRLIRGQDKVNLSMKEAADAATAAGQAKSRFLAQMSHEIRTPINAILGMNEMILRESEDKDILEYSDNIRTAGKTLLSLINSILDFSKIDDGKMEIIPVEYDTISVINNLINSVSSRAASKGLDFITEIDENLPTSLIGDDVRITQVILNLLTNAVKYTERGSVTFSIVCGERTDTGITLTVAVKDTGIGIRSEDIGKMFESFSRLDETRNRNIEGTGLGMAIVTKLLDLMDSRLEVESVYGSGSVFSFEVKQGIADSKPIGKNIERRAAAEHREEKKEKPHFDGAKVLITDDNEMNLKVAKNLMKIFGIVPELAVSGSETVELMRKNRYDILFLDHMMPKMDGIETLKKLREENLVPESTTVIALTANAVNGARETYLNAGFDDYLSKPIEIDQLEKKLMRYLNAVPADDSGKSDADISDSEVIEFAPVEGDVLEFEPEGGEDAAESATSDSSGADTEDMIGKLNEAGISAKDGLAYCAGDFGFYREMLSDYALSYEKRTEELEKAYAENDAENYCIYVHALKSISKTVGVMDVSELAKSLEFAAKNGDTEYITAHHAELIALFGQRKECIAGIIGK